MISKFLSTTNGGGIHHIAVWAVGDIEGLLARLKLRGIRLIDEHPRDVGAEGGVLWLVHPAVDGGVYRVGASSGLH